jgi:hypothetical protein
LLSLRILLTSTQMSHHTPIAPFFLQLHSDGNVESRSAKCKS